MTVLRKKINLLIRELNVLTKEGKNDENARIMRENLRRIKLYLDGVATGDIIVGAAEEAETSTNADFAEATRYEEHLCTSDGQTAFVLDFEPEDTSKVRMLINSCEVINGRHFSVIGQNVTFFPLIADFELEVNNELGLQDIINFQYIKA